MLLSSCKTVAPQILRETSFQFDRCMLYCVDRNLKSIPMLNCDDRYKDEPTRLTVRAPLKSCDKTFGVKIEKFAEELRPQVRRAIRDCENCKKR